jgi:uncharacterized protein YyaL (SSP411 family)
MPRRLLRSLFISVGGLVVVMIAMVLAPPASILGQEGVAPAQQESPPSEESPPPPVEWFPWTEELFARAREEQRGVLLTIVGPWCRKCEIADREVWSDPTVRRLVARYWIPVRIDRMERPDLDSRYQIALAVLNYGKGGYPLTAFLFPSGEAMWADLHVPARDGVKPGMRSLLNHVSRLWKTQFGEARKNAVAVQETFDREDQEKRPATLDPVVVSLVSDVLIENSDPDHGGYRAPPRSKNPLAAELVLLTSLRRQDPGLEVQAIEALRGPVRGAVFDRIEGGFHRGTVEPDWSVPIFGKTLSTNAVYLHALTEAIRITGDADLRWAAEMTVNWILARLAAPGGGFYAAQAPSVTGTGEASYYSWTVNEVRTLLSEKEAQWAEALFGLRDSGEPTLGLPRSFTFKASEGAEEAMKTAGLDPSDAGRWEKKIHSKLAAAREKRERPPVLEIQYLESTALASAALLHAAPILEDERAGDAALAALDRILREHPVAKGVPHRLHSPGRSPILMVEQGHLGNALLDAAEYTGERKYVEAASILAGTMLDLFDSPAGAFYDVVEQKEAAGYIRLRRKRLLDPVLPSPQATAGRFFARLGWHTDDESFLERAGKALAWNVSRLPAFGHLGTSLALAMDILATGPIKITIHGSGEDAQTLRRAAMNLYEPAKVILTASDEGSPGASAVICVGDRCRERLGSAEALSQALKSLRSGVGP